MALTNEEVSRLIDLADARLGVQRPTGIKIIGFRPVPARRVPTEQEKTRETYRARKKLGLATREEWIEAAKFSLAKPVTPQSATGKLYLFQRGLCVLCGEEMPNPFFEEGRALLQPREP